MPAYSRQIGAHLTELNGERAFIDGIPADHPMTDAIVPGCDFLCALAEDGLADHGPLFADPAPGAAA